jgi:hypothetical protein
MLLLLFLLRAAGHLPGRPRSIQQCTNHPTHPGCDSYSRALCEPPTAPAARRLQLRGGTDGAARFDSEGLEWQDNVAPGRFVNEKMLPLDDESFKWMEDVQDDEPAWHRPARIGHSHVVESIRVIPADANQVLGGSAHVPDHSIREWFWADAAAAGATRAAAGAPVLSVPDQVPSVHRAVGACPQGGIVSVRSGLFRWDGAIKIRKGRLPSASQAASAAFASASALRNGSAPSDSSSSRAHRSCGDVAAGAANGAGGAGGAGAPSAEGGRGIHVRGVDGTVLMGQWLLGRGSAGSLRRVGLAGNLTLFYQVVLDIHAGPWVLEEVECRCVGGGVANVCEWSEVDCSLCVFGGMGEALQLRAASGFLISGYGNVRIQQSEITMLGGKLITSDEQASFASNFWGRGRGEGGGGERGLSEGDERQVADDPAPAADVCGLGIAVVEEGHVHCLNTSFVDVGVGVTVYGNGSAVLVGCTLRDLNAAAFSAPDIDPESEEEDDVSKVCLGGGRLEEYGGGGAMCIVNCKTIGGLTWLDGHRPKYLNDYLFQGYKIEPPPGLLPKIAAALDAEQAEDIRLESARSQRDALLKRVLIDMDPSLFPEDDEHHYVYHPSEARPNPDFDEFFEQMYPGRAAHALSNAKAVSEGSEGSFFVSRRDGRQMLLEDPRVYRTPEPGDAVVCYNCGRVDAHFGSWCIDTRI